MIIDADVRSVSRIYAVSDTFTALIQAVVTAEGNIVKAVQCSIPSVKTRDDALHVVCRSAIHAMADFLSSGGGSKAAFVAFWGARWAPPNVANDPTHLNANWSGNVEKLWV